MFATLTTYINNLVEYIKKTYTFIYNNYNYKQIFLLFLVFFTIFFVEMITRINSEFVIPSSIPQKIPLINTQPNLPKKKVSVKNKSYKKVKRTIK
jgi:hypothetical protein